MIHILHEKASTTQIQDMLQEYDTMIKIVVDIRQRILSGGGEMHADCESTLLESGSEQDDLWGANAKAGGRNHPCHPRRSAMTNKEKLKQRFLRDPLEKRLGGLAATLARVSSSARNSESPVLAKEWSDKTLQSSGLI